MAGAHVKKRGREDAPRSKATRPSKKLKKQTNYHSSSSENGSDAEDANGDFQAVNLLDSDEDDIHNAKVDDGAESESDDGASSSGSDAPAPQQRKEKHARLLTAKNAPKSALAKDAPSDESDAEIGADEEEEEDDDDDEDIDEYSDLDDEAGSDEEAPDSKRKHKTKSKRSDPDAFATSLSKILSTKLSSTRRADPVLARSAEAQEASRKAVDTALEQKARKKLRDQKRLALEKGRVRDVLVATNSTFSNVNPVTGEVLKDAPVGETTAEILETERRLRKVAQRGVVQLFNAFRTAQVKAAEAQRVTKKEGVIGIDRKKEKITEMSKKGFLDLIASGGGGLRKAPLEEA